MFRKALSSAWSRNTPLCSTNWFCSRVFEKLLFKLPPTINCPYDSLQELVFHQFSTTESFSKRQKVSTYSKVTSTRRQGLKLPELLDGRQWWIGTKTWAEEDSRPAQPHWALELIHPLKSYSRNHFSLEIALRCFKPGVPQQVEITLLLQMLLLWANLPSKEQDIYTTCWMVVFITFWKKQQCSFVNQKC